MKKSIEYYQHYANADRHPKFMYLRMKFGWEGEGKFWALNNAIAESSGCKLDLNEVYNRIAIANRLDFDLDGFDEFIAFLVFECKLLILEEGLLYSNITQENFRTVMKERKKARERKLKHKEDKKICQKKFGRTFEESKVNEIKEIKGEGIKEKPPEVFSSPLPQIFENISLLDEYFSLLNNSTKVNNVEFVKSAKGKLHSRGEPNLYNP